MLPSNISPTILPSASISGLPEFPPTMSLLVEMQNGVCIFQLSLTLIQLTVS